MGRGHQKADYGVVTLSHKDPAVIQVLKRFRLNQEVQRGQTSGSEPLFQAPLELCVALSPLPRLLGDSNRLVMGSVQLRP